ncbi:hypothetical protein K501DRAFT_269415 [Backusella circina FSU 941]|nr:hypothetical protein K501DRAFT_269415 [Backusella circina FSU 941]
MAIKVRGIQLSAIEGYLALSRYYRLMSEESKDMDKMKNTKRLPYSDYDSDSNSTKETREFQDWVPNNYIVSDDEIAMGHSVSILLFFTEKMIKKVGYNFIF